MFWMWLQVCTVLVIGYVGFVWALIPTFALLIHRADSTRLSSLRHQRHWVILLTLFGMFRIGEASNPGPCAQFEDFGFTLGTFNPTGMRDKAQYFHTHLSYGDVWTMSETHFYGKDVSRFRAQAFEHAILITNFVSPTKALLGAV